MIRLLKLHSKGARMVQPSYSVRTRLDLGWAVFTEPSKNTFSIGHSIHPRNSTWSLGDGTTAPSRTDLHIYEMILAEVSFENLKPKRKIILVLFSVT